MMREYAIVAVACVLGSATVALREPPTEAEREREKLVGTWEVISVEANGQKFPAEATRDFRYIFTADTATRKKGEKAESGAGYRLDPSRSPKWIDMTGKKDGKDHAIPGLYSLEGDTLKLCFRTDYKKDGKPTDAPLRPTRLDGGAGSEQVLMILKREKR
jgi:uncharacterized protein (TIGR03067 family)